MQRRDDGASATPPSGSPERRPEDSPLLRTFFDKRENLLLFLASRTRCMATAEDLIQDLYLRVSTLEAGPEVRSPASLLYRMAANILIDHARSTQRASRRNAEWRTETRAVLGDDDVVDEPPADEVLVGKERVRQLAQAVAALPPKMGQAFRLHKLEGLSQAQTAQAMGISAKMVEQHIAAAIRHLSQRLRS